VNRPVDAWKKTIPFSGFLQPFDEIRLLKVVRNQSKLNRGNRIMALQNCPRCARPIPGNAVQGLCPQCMLQVGLENESQWSAGASVTTPYLARFVPPAPADLNKRFPQLEIVELLGQGGMGAVYKARQPGLDRFVALKILPPEVGKDPAFAERFTREARALARLNHPGIVGVYDFGQAAGLYYLLMEYVDGANARQLMHSGGIHPREALALIPQICDALQFAHEEGIVHRDIKPENLLVDKRGRVKIADFGLAKILALPLEEANLTEAQQVMGTPHYMSPEQIERPLDVDHRTDIYALGVVFYEMLTGELPVGRFAPPSSKVQIDVRLDEVVLRALENKPELRYQHACDVKTDVQTIVGVNSKAWNRAFAKEYISSRKIFGWPLLHVAMGYDPATGKKRIAKGIFAVGDVAIGVVAMGGTAIGGLCLGGLTLGVFGFGGLSFALIAIGGCAVGACAFGGFAAGIIALGGVSVGVYSYGGLGWGLHILAGNRQDPEGIAFFEPWAHAWWKWLVAMFTAYALLKVWATFRIRALLKRHAIPTISK
jgi:predicted Ser/Thr protein kinase